MSKLWYTLAHIDEDGVITSYSGLGDLPIPDPTLVDFSTARNAIRENKNQLLNLYIPRKPFPLGGGATRRKRLVALGRIDNVDQWREWEPDMDLVEAFPDNILPKDKNLHVVAVRSSEIELMKEALDELGQMRTAYLKKREATAPSDAGIPSKFARDQESPERAIDCGRPRKSPIDIPVALLFEGFGKFQENIRKRPSPGSINHVAAKMANELSKFFDNEKGRQEKLESLIIEALGVQMTRTSFRVPSKTKAYEIDIATTSHLGLLAGGEVKNETTGSCDPTFEIYCHYVEYARFKHEARSQEALPGGRLPAMLMTHIGPNLQVHGSVFGSRPHTEVLTSQLPLYFNPMNMEMREELGRVLYAMRTLLEDITAYHQSCPEQFDHGEANQLDFPYPHSYPNQSDGSDVRFRYDERLERLVFDAVDSTGKRIIVKFARYYGIDAHKTAASLSFAPALLGWRELPGGWFMVVMDRVPDGFSEYADVACVGAQAKALEVVKQLHGKGFVHGDFRDTNIFMQNCGEDHWDCRLIDFDWAGPIGKVKYPLNTTTTEYLWRPRLFMDGEEVTVKDDIEMARKLSVTPRIRR